MHRISSQNVVELLLDAVCIVEPDSRILFVSPAFERIFGYAPQEVVGRRMLDLLHPDDLAATKNQVQGIMEGDLQLQFENRYLRKDGSTAHILWTARWLPDQQVRLGVAHDITERKVNEIKQAAVYAISEAAHAVDNLDALFSRIHEIIGELLVAPHFSVAMREPGTGTELHHVYRTGEQGAALDNLSACADARCAEVVRTARPLLASPTASSQTAGGAQKFSWLGVPLLGEAGVFGALIVQSGASGGTYDEHDRDLLQFVSTQIAAAIERKQMIERLKQMAQFDELTKLPNRMLLLDRLHIALERASRDGTLVSLLFVDLDDFKRVNDSLGHAMGDLLLQQVAARLLAAVRASDTVARLGGDEFVVLLESGRVKDHASTVARKILKAFRQPFDLQGSAVNIHPSIGTALSPEHGREAQELIDHADRAMYASKQSGGNQVRSAV